MIKTRNNLATLVYTKAIEDRVKSKYLKRIDYLVEANNELMNELEQCESEIITVEKECYGRGSV
jgi:demethoxyubiquinone hydroxylase (CLK1/Coq7/Cat5 family)